MMLAGPMIATLFQSDVFDANDVAMAERSLMAYSFGLQAFILIKVLAPGFYARQDTRTPVKIGVIAMAVNMLLNLALIFPLQHAGLALATSLSAYLNAYPAAAQPAARTGLHARRRVAPPGGAGGCRRGPDGRIAGLGLAANCSDWVEAGRLQRVGMLAGLIGLGAAVYFAVLLALGVRLRDLRVRRPGGDGLMLRLLWLSLLVIVLDQLSKYWIVASFQDYEVLTVWPVFNLTLVYNTGAAFSFLSDAGGWQRWFFVVIGVLVSAAMVIWLARLQPRERLTAYGLALVVGGAVGNLIDRIWLGKVVDFLQWHWQDWYWPSFNWPTARSPWAWFCC